MIHSFQRGRVAAALVLSGVAASAACSDRDPVQLDPGSLEVVVNASGTDIDQRYSVQVNTGTAEAYFAGRPFVRVRLAAGTYTVRISGISSNCTLRGDDVVQVSVADGQRAQATFAITCAMRWLAATESRYDDEGTRIVRMNRDGTGRVVLTPGFGVAQHPAISPDGTRIAFSSSRDGSQEIYVMNADGSNPVRLTSLPSGSAASPTWSPDGTRIAFIWEDYPSAPEVRIVNADGTGLTTVMAVPGLWAPLRWSPDGARLAFVLMADLGEGALDIDVYTLTLATGSVARLTANPGMDTDPDWMEDGRLVYLTVAPGINGGIAAVQADGTGGEVLFDSPGHVEFSPAMSAHNALAFASQPANGGWSQLWVVPATGGVPVKITTESAHYYHPAWQP